MRTVIIMTGVLFFSYAAHGQNQATKDNLTARFNVQANIKFLGAQLTPDHYDLFDSLQADPHNSYFDISIRHGQPLKKNMGNATVKFTFDFESYSDYVAWRRSERTYRLIDLLHDKSSALDSHFVTRKDAGS